MSEPRATNAGAEDAGEILAFIDSEYPHSPYLKMSGEERTTPLADRRNALISGFKSGQCTGFLVRDQGSVAGYLQITRGLLKKTRHCADFGITVGHSHRKKGIGKILCSKMISWFGAQSDITRLQLQVMSENQAAIRLFESAGFIREGVRQKAFLQDGRYLDEVMMARLKADSPDGG